MDSESVNREHFGRHIMGPVEEQVERTTKSDTITPPKLKKGITLRSIINIRDFEKAAEQRLAPEAFACRLSIIPIGTSHH